MKKKIKIKKLKKKEEAQNTFRYIRREIIEINPLHTSIPDNVLEKKVCDAFPLASILVKQEDLHICHWITDQNKVIINFKDRKQAYHVMYNRKKLANNEGVKSLGFGNELFTTESMRIKNLFYRCQTKSIEENSFVLAL